MDDSLRAGIAIYNAGETHAAHDAWEETWLELPKGSDDEQLLHGLIQYTAAIYHAQNRNWSGAVGLAESGRAYLTELPSTYRGVELTTVRGYLRALEVDPERIERAAPPELTFRGQSISAADLELGAITTAAAVLAAELEAYDESVIEDAIDYAREEADESHTQFISLLTTFVDESTHRGIVYERLAAQVERRRQKQQDVAGLFEPADDSET